MSWKELSFFKSKSLNNQIPACRGVLFAFFTLLLLRLGSLSQQKSLFCLPTKGTFLNDVCPIGQMMPASPMMYASHMMCLRTWVANIASLFACEQHHFGAKRRNIISRHRRRHHSFVLFGCVKQGKTDIMKISSLSPIFMPNSPCAIS